MTAPVRPPVLGPFSPGASDQALMKGSGAKPSRLDQYGLSPLTQLGGLFSWRCGAWQGVDATFHAVASWRGRCDRRGKSGGPPLLGLSLKVKWNSAHERSSVL